MSQFFPAGMNKIQTMTFCSKLLVYVESLQKELLLNMQNISDELVQKYNSGNEFDFHLVFDNEKHDICVLEKNSKIGCSWESNNFSMLKKLCLFKKII